MESNIVDRLLRSAIEEDLPWGDVTSDNLIDPRSESELVLTVYEDGVIAGLPVAGKVFKMLDDRAVWTPTVQDGDTVRVDDVVAKARGRTRNLLKAERTALNFLQRLSGIASLTRQFVESARSQSDIVRIVDTRRTTPGLRYLEKYAVRVGGGYNHRFCLSDAVLMKSDHLAKVYEEGKSIKMAVSEIKDLISHTVNIEVEINSVDQLSDALLSKAEVLRLKNMNIEQLKQVVRRVNGRKKLDAAGGVTIENVAEVAATGVDFISVDSLTQSAKALDVRYRILPVHQERYGSHRQDEPL